ncbi:MAG: OmpA family protein [Planctomycetota bacterium]|nr:OmpA family protein [Planctomycetota bacterium]
MISGLAVVLLFSACAIGRESALRVENGSLKDVVDQADAAVRNSEDRIRVLEEQLRGEILLRSAAEEKVVLLKDVVQRLRGAVSDEHSGAYESIRDGFEINPQSGAIILSDAVYFASGKHSLSARGKENLRVLAQRLGSTEYGMFNVRVDGHTDNQPIRRSKYRDNWDLGFQRAQAVQEFFSAEGIDTARIFIASFADTQPIASNSTAAGKKKNRRVEIQIIDGE